MQSAYPALAVLFSVACPASAQEESKVILDKLAAAPKPAAQKDLDTVALASAHRERNASMQERTDGLYQSWLVSICKGCGADQHKYSAKDAEDLIKRARAQTKVDPVVDRAAKPKATTNTYVGLSPDAVAQIRRTPSP